MVEGRKGKCVAEMGGVSESAALPDSISPCEPLDREKSLPGFPRITDKVVATFHQPLHCTRTMLTSRSTVGRTAFLHGGARISPPIPSASR
jgi:hypothetical protein